MKYSILTCVVILFYLQTKSQGVDFISDASWKEIQDKARKENKYIFIDVFTTWCGPCRTMDREVFPLAEVGDYFNDKFVSVKVQLDSTNRDTEVIKRWYNDAKVIGEKYFVTAFPTYIFLSPNAELVHTITGARSKDEIINDAEFALDTSRAFNILLNMFRDSMLTSVQIKELTRRAVEYRDTALSRMISVSYINGLAESEMFLPENVEFIYDFTFRTTDRGYNFFKDKAHKISKVYPKYSVAVSKAKVNQIESSERNMEMNDSVSLSKRNSLKIIFSNDIEPLLKGKVSFKKLIAEVQSRQLGPQESLLLEQIIQWYIKRVVADKLKGGQSSINEPRILIQLSRRFLKEYGMDLSAITLNQYCWLVFGYFSSTEILKSFLDWSELAVSKDPLNSMCMDTYANLLYKIGHKKKAIYYQKKAVQLTPADREINENYLKMVSDEKTWTY